MDQNHRTLINCTVHPWNVIFHFQMSDLVGVLLQSITVIHLFLSTSDMSDWANLWMAGSVTFLSVQFLRIYRISDCVRRACGGGFMQFCISAFLSRVSILLLTRDIDIAILSVRPSVPDTLVLYENGLTYRHSFSTIR